MIDIYNKHFKSLYLNIFQHKNAKKQYKTKIEAIEFEIYVSTKINDDTHDYNNEL